MTGAAIELDGLTKRYGSVLAVDDLRLQVPRGAIYGFLGPNGSGKTTTLGMLTGLIPPDAGTARIEGVDVREDLPRALARVGALIEEPTFYPYLSGERNLRLLARVRGLDDPNAAAQKALERTGLAGAPGDAKYKGYSLGMRRRLGLAAALLGEPRVLVLDEPTNGLDPAGQREVRALLHEAAREGRTVLVSSHVLPEVQDTCTHVAIVRRGRLVANGVLGEVLGTASAIVATVDDPASALAIVRKLAGVRDARVEGATVRVDAPVELAAEINRALVEAGVAVSALARAEAALEDRFLEMTKEGAA